MFQRPEYLHQLIQFKDTNFIQVITGVRRSGKSVLLMLFRDYLLKEGIAEESIKDTIVLNDVALRAGVKEPAVLKSIIRFLADNVGQLVNTSKIVHTLKSEGIETTTHTVNRYLDLLENSFLFYQAKQYDIRGREYLRTNGKYFVVDAGLRRNAVQKDGTTVIGWKILFIWNYYAEDIPLTSVSYTKRKLILLLESWTNPSIFK